ncbi:MAG: hypothetical protein WC350_05965 [Candidatus Micrarchaeia archaeon]
MKNRQIQQNQCAHLDEPFRKAKIMLAGNARDAAREGKDCTQSPPSRHTHKEERCCRD